MTTVVTSESSPGSTSIDIASCPPSEAIVVTTGSSVYEVIVLQGDFGEVSVRGGKHFAKFCSALLVGSRANGGPIKPSTMDVGLRIVFRLDDRIVVTSPVQSLFRRVASAARPIAVPENEAISDLN